MSETKYILYDKIILRLGFLARHVKYNIVYNLKTFECALKLYLKMPYGIKKVLNVIDGSKSDTIAIQNVKGKCEIIFELIRYTSGSSLIINNFSITIGHTSILFFVNNNQLRQTLSYSTNLIFRKEYTTEQKQKIKEITDDIIVYDENNGLTDELQNMLSNCNISRQSSFEKQSFIYTMAIAKTNNHLYHIIDQVGKLGIPVITNHKSDYPNVIYVSNWSTESIIDKILFVANNHNRFIDKIKESVIKHINNEVRTNHVSFVPVWGRHHILKKCLDSLKKQKNSECFCVCSNQDDVDFVKAQGVPYINFINQPLGDKFQAGIEFAKIYYGKSVIICGSDDYLSNDYVEEADKYLDLYDLIGKRNWIIHDIKSDIIYKLKYNHPIVKDCWGNPTDTYDMLYDTNNMGFSLNICKTFPFMIGSGRVIKCEFLNKINWSVYPSAFRTLDTLSLYYLIVMGAKYISIDDDKFNVCSIKDDGEMMTSIDDILGSKNVTNYT